MQKIWTEGKGVMTPIQKLIMFVTEVIVMETAASSKEADILSGTDEWIEVRRHAPNMTNVSSIPIPAKGIGNNFDWNNFWQRIETNVGINTSNKGDLLRQKGLTSKGGLTSNLIWSKLILGD